MSSRRYRAGHTPSDASVEPRKSRIQSILLQTAHRYSSYVLSGFISLHFVNTCIIPMATWSSSSKTAVSNIDDAFTITRYIYRPSLTIEMGLIFLSLLVHIACGVVLRTIQIRNLYREGIVSWYERQTQINIANGFAWAHIRALPTFDLSDIAASGYITWFCVTLHIYTVRNVPWKYAGDGETSITIVTHALQKHPRLFYTLYYSLLSAGPFHIISGWGKWLGLTVTPRATLVKNYVVMVVNVLWLTALIRVGRLEIFSDALKVQYDVLYRYFWGGF
jgi:tRNA (guanine26-N2/guanine27-N2)-dimethyltransferase